MKRSLLVCALIAFSMMATPLSADIIVVNGNGNTGFGGTVGTGSITLDHTGTAINGTFARGGGTLNNAVVLYFDTDLGATGFGSTAGFTDTADGLRRAISGNDDGPNQTVATFASGFLANYAVAFDAGFGGLWQLQNGGSHTFIASVGLSPTGDGSAASHTFSFNLSQVGAAANAPLRFVGSFISDSGFRSNESFGDIGAVPANPGFSGPIAFSNYFTAVPEPSSLVLVASLGLLTAGRKRRRA